MANAKFISYDLRAPGRNYDGLYEAIKSYSTWAHVCESDWIVVTTDSCESVANNLLQQMDYNDRIFVYALSGEAAWKNVLCKDDWLKTNL